MTPEKGKNPNQGGKTVTRQVTGWKSPEAEQKFLKSIMMTLTPEEKKKYGDKIKTYVHNGSFGNLEMVLNRAGTSHHVYKQLRNTADGRGGWMPNMGYEITETNADGTRTSHKATAEEIKLIQKAQSTYSDRYNAWVAGGKKGPKPRRAVQGRTSAASANVRIKQK